MFSWGNVDFNNTKYFSYCNSLLFNFFQLFFFCRTFERFVLAHFFLLFLFSFVVGIVFLHTIYSYWDQVSISTNNLTNSWENILFSKTGVFFLRKKHFTNIQNDCQYAKITMYRSIHGRYFHQNVLKLTSLYYVILAICRSF